MAGQGEVFEVLGRADHTHATGLLRELDPRDRCVCQIEERRPTIVNVYRDRLVERLNRMLGELEVTVEELAEQDEIQMQPTPGSVQESRRFGKFKFQNLT